MHVKIRDRGRSVFTTREA